VPTERWSILWNGSHNETPVDGAIAARRCGGGQRTSSCRGEGVPSECYRSLWQNNRLMIELGGETVLKRVCRHRPAAAAMGAACGSHC